MSTQSIKPQGRVLYFDILNIAATFGVIMLHCNGLAHTYSETLRCVVAEEDPRC